MKFYIVHRSGYPDRIVSEEQIVEISAAELAAELLGANPPEITGELTKELVQELVRIASS